MASYYTSIANGFFFLAHGINLIVKTSRISCEYSIGWYRQQKLLTVFNFFAIVEVFHILRKNKEKDVAAFLRNLDHVLDECQNYVPISRETKEEEKTIPH
jgi:uncharacterized protein YhhL (DUF1145 family)